MKAAKGEIDASEYQSYEKDGYIIYFYAPTIKNIEKLHNSIIITEDDLTSFYNEFKSILPDSITKWEELFD